MKTHQNAMFELEECLGDCMLQVRRYCTFVPTHPIVIRCIMMILIQHKMHVVIPWLGRTVKPCQDSRFFLIIDFQIQIFESSILGFFVWFYKYLGIHVILLWKHIGTDHVAASYFSFRFHAAIFISKNYGCDIYSL